MVADSDRPGVLTPAVAAADSVTDRYTQVVRVLYQVLALNLAVAFVKLALGSYTGAVSILSDGFHSLTD